MGIINMLFCTVANMLRLVALLSTMLFLYILNQNTYADHEIKLELKFRYCIMRYEF